MTDIVDRLREATTHLPTGEDHDWERDLLMEAANTIDRLRVSLEAVLAVSGKAERGQSFAEITKDMKRRDASYEPSVGRDSTTGGC